jgi:hypothetical protein
VLMGARLYDPLTGRFLQVDSVFGGSCNAYDYAGQDPLNYTDVSGQASCYSDRVNGNVGYIEIQSNGASGYVWGAYMYNPSDNFGLWIYTVTLHKGNGTTTSWTNANDPTHLDYPPHNQITSTDLASKGGTVSITITVTHIYEGKFLGLFAYPKVAKGTLTCPVV